MRGRSNIGGGIYTLMSSTYILYQPYFKKIVRFKKNQPYPPTITITFDAGRGLIYGVNVLHDFYQLKKKINRRA